MKSADKIFSLFTLAVFIGLLLPVLLKDGMFLDGVTYSCISKNLANNIGELWKPHYTKTLYPAFYEHPPLVFGIQSLFFRLMGNGIYPERIYSFFTAIFVLIGIILNWKLFTNNSKFQTSYWLPILLWILTPVVFWSFGNNMLENTLSVFTVFSVYFICKALIQVKVLWLIPGGVLVLLSFLSKGFVGLFPLVSIIFYSLIFRNIKINRTILYTLLILLVPIGLLFILIFLFPESKNNITHYFNRQLIPSLRNENEITTDYRIGIILKLITELLFPLIILGIYLIRSRFTKYRTIFSYNKAAIFFICIGLSASIPIIITLKQRGYYLVPSIPFFVIGLSLFLCDPINNLIEKIPSQIKLWLKRLAIILVLFSLLLSLLSIGKINRDKEKLHDIYILTRKIPPGTIIGTIKENCSDWGLIAYLGRMGYLSLDSDNKHEYFLLNKENIIDSTLLKQYQEVSLGLLKFKLLQRIN
ncbi:MAG: hypothetical protein AUJ97_04315 [Bacteroidetes bacterium CG2_30_32_10]|nr:MAG: hypothetical protein AUJ97_04315 [Bacteroidetes bacterium CG2_30_32_10]